MKAVVLNGGRTIEHLHMVDREKPEPNPGQVLVRIRATSLNYRDYEIITGSFNREFPLPLVPLSDCAGDIVVVGKDVTRVKIGDRVCGTFWQGWYGGPSELADPTRQLGGAMQGVLAEYVALDQDGVVQFPNHLSYEEAATLPCAAVTAWHALVTEGHLKAGDDVLIQGTGGVSVFALQFAVMSGARAIVLSSSQVKCEQALQLGAATTINYREEPNWSNSVLAFTRGRGVDHVVEVGGPETLTQSLLALRLAGQINVVGYLGGVDGRIDPLMIFRRRARVRGISVGSKQSFSDMNRAIETNGMRPVIDSVFDWKDVGEALLKLKSGRHFGKIVLTVGS
ncbi:zinc-dependent alcohol dehydrogenase family protein [Microvirga pudoricolor]|uniref:zinc-dependent alcohol dehydrogenase family protein n=1 Tax=Microvirga pudoricolor TaxID=2778729 RepID=UPI0019503A16|nr:NAD(P)-dependent alcohol dehydrogenase [Microvirga pudoricolor]MBM6595301.1 NAD(P)-dependent alcohol dehydrogenase [Microvirga pudoricolor]